MGGALPPGASARSERAAGLLRETRGLATRLGDRRAAMDDATAFVLLASLHRRASVWRMVGRWVAVVDVEVLPRPAGVHADSEVDDDDCMACSGASGFCGVRGRFGLRALARTVFGDGVLGEGVVGDDECRCEEDGGDTRWLNTLVEDDGDDGGTGDAFFSDRDMAAGGVILTAMTMTMTIRRRRGDQTIRAIRRCGKQE